MNLSRLVAMFALVTPLAGCPKKPVVLDTTTLVDPTMAFDEGVKLLAPDRAGAVDYSNAYLAFQKSIELNGGPKAQFNAGWTSERMGDAEKAQTHYQAAFDADAGYTAAAYSLARVKASRGDHAGAAAVWEKYLTAHPEDKDARRELIGELGAAGQLEAAVTMAQQMLLADPTDAGVYRALSGVYFEANNYSMSMIMAEKALALNPSDSGTQNNLGLTWIRRGEEREAVERFKSALELDPKNLEANLNLGYIALESGDYGLAMQCFQAAVEKAPASTDALLGLAVSQRGSNDLDAAEKTYKQIIKLDPKNELAYFDASVLHEKYTKDFKKAGSYLQAYVDAMGTALPADHEVHRRIARVEQSKAEEEARKAAEAARKREEEERRKRNEELLAQMKLQVDNIQSKLTTNAACLPEETAMELGMIVEQANVVITEKDADLAGDIQSLIKDYAQPMLDGALAEHCAAAAPAPAPTEAPPAAPTEGAPAAPAEGAPAAPVEGTPSPG